MSLRLATVQYTPEFGNKSANFERISALLAPISADVIILPELCTTGYFFQSREECSEYAEPSTGETVEFFKRLAREKNALLVAGFAQSGGRNLYNSALIYEPELNRAQIYRKSHLFYKERFCFDDGNTGFFVVNNITRNIRLGVMICYDWRFPEAARALALQGADVIACPANLVTDAWHLVMPARAIENKVYVAVANRGGIENRGGEEVVFKGKSAVYGYNGSTLCEAPAEGDSVLFCEISPEQTRDKSFNSLNDVLRDRRPELYGVIAERR